LIVATRPEELQPYWGIVRRVLESVLDEASEARLGNPDRRGLQREIHLPQIADDMSRS
jgi:hypothetical protein